MRVFVFCRFVHSEIFCYW